MPGRPKRAVKNRSKMHKKKVLGRKTQRRKIKSRKRHG